MRVDKILTSLRKDRDHDTLHRTGEEVGNELSRLRTKELRELQHGLAKLPASEDPFAMGYLAAVGDVISAFLLAVSEQEDFKEVEAELVNRRWIDVLRAIRGGHLRVTEIAAALRTDKGTISNLLEEMRAADLVESFADMGDKRSRPHRMTARGERVLRSVHDLPPAFEDGVTCAVHGLATLRDREALSKEVLASELRCAGRDPNRVAAFLVETAARCGFASCEGDQVAWDHGFAQPMTLAFVGKLGGELERLAISHALVRAEGNVLDALTVLAKTTPTLRHLEPVSWVDLTNDPPLDSPWVYMSRALALSDESRGIGSRRQRKFIAVSAEEGLRVEPLET